MDAAKLQSQMSFRPEQVANVTGLSVTHIRRAIREGRLKSHKDGRAVVVTRQAIQAYLDGLQERKVQQWQGGEKAKVHSTRHGTAGTSSPIGKPAAAAAPSAPTAVLPWNRE